MNEVPSYPENPEINTQSQTATDVDTATRNVIAEYASPGVDAATPKPPRKKRSDAGVKRGNKKIVALDTTEDKKDSDSGSGENAGYVLDKQIVIKTVRVMLNTVDAAVLRKIYKVARGTGADEQSSAELAKTAGLTVSEADTMGELTGIIFEKHGLLTGYAPELLLGVMVTAWGGRVVVTMRQLNVMVAEQKALAAKREKLERERE